jgi:hypothetical protein
MSGSISYPVRLPTQVQRLEEFAQRTLRVPSAAALVEWVPRARLLLASLAVTGALDVKKVDIEHSRHVLAPAGDNQNSIAAK